MATDFLERTLEDIIYNTSKSDLVTRGLFIEGVKFRQVRIGYYGIADMVTIKRDWTGLRAIITIYELKKSNIDVSALLQASRYVVGIRSYLRKRGLFQDCQLDFKIRLIGKSVSNNDFSYLCSWKNIQTYTYSYDFDGITFKKEFGYILSNEGF